LVGFPLLLAVYYSVSAYTIYDPTWRFVGFANFAQIIQNPTFIQTLSNTFIFTFGSQLLGLVLGKFGAFLLLRPFPGRKIVRLLIILPFAVPVALATIAWRWLFDSLYSVFNWYIDRAWHARTCGRAELARQSFLSDAVRGDHQRLALLSVCHRDLSGRHYRGAAGCGGCCHGERRRLLASQLPDHPADDPADHGDRPDLWHRLHLHRSFHRLSADDGRPSVGATSVLGFAGFQTGIVSGDVSHGAAISLFMLPVLLIVVVFMLRFIRRREI
jgi:multiple sugar transport system permease protein